MQTRLWLTDPAMLLLWAAVALSFAFWPLVLWLGFDTPPAGFDGNYKTYFELTNWWPYPLFFLGLAPGLWLTWQPLLNAWEGLAITGVLRDGNGRPDAGTLTRVREAVQRRRPLAWIGALAIAVFINLIDWVSLIPVYTGGASLAEQHAFACDRPNPFVKWILDAPLPELSAGQEANAGARAAIPGLSPPAGQIIFTGITALQQFLIVLLSALAVMQVLLHTALFGAFERLEVARAHKLRLLLNGASPVNEFGLEHWNHALNNFYWSVSPALLGVFLSRAATSPEAYHPGQVMLGFAVPLCLLAPMIGTIIVRQNRLPQVWTTLHPDGPVAPEDYHRQQLWPLDRNWSSKLGIIFSFALAALSIGFEVTRLVSL